jgi:hypothetical protein
MHQPELTFGRSRRADLVWNQPSIAPLHLRVYWTERKVYLEPLEGPVRSVSSEERLRGKQLWEIGEYYRVGDKHLVLQTHPVGPVIRAVDSEAAAFLEFSGLRPGHSGLGTRGMVLREAPLQSSRRTPGARLTAV